MRSNQQCLFLEDGNLGEMVYIYPLLYTSLFSGPRGLQLQVFKTEVDQQRLIPTLRSYLKLYSTLPISKLAKFMDMQENEVRCCLMAFKHKKEIVSHCEIL